MKLKKILNIVEIVLIAIGAIAFLYWMISSGDTNVDGMLYVAYAFMGIAAVAALGMSAANFGKGKNNSKIGLIVGGLFVIFALVFYFVFASSVPVTGADGTVYSNQFTLQITDTMLYMAYMALGAIVVIMLAGGIRNAIK